MPHLTGRTRRKGDGQTAPRIMLPGKHSVGDAMGDRPSLASASPSKHHDRSAKRQSNFPLLRIKGVEHLISRQLSGTHRRRNLSRTAG